MATNQIQYMFPKAEIKHLPRNSTPALKYRSPFKALQPQPNKLVTKYNKTMDPSYVRVFKRFYLFIFSERGQEGERERNRYGKETWIGCLLYVPQLGTQPATQACALDQESNWRPFALRADSQPTEPHWSGASYSQF